MLIGLLLRAVIETRLVLIPILIGLVPILLRSVFLGTFPCVQGHVLVLLLKLAVLLLAVGLVVVPLGDLVEMNRIQNPTFE
jgi:hypothetical protein